MCGKVKSIVLLLLLLVMIYYQHSPVLHAEDMKTGQAPEEQKQGEQNYSELCETENEFAEEKEGKDSTDAENGDYENKEEVRETEDRTEGDGRGDDGENDYQGGREEKEKKDEEAVIGYHLELPEADGKNGYYVAAPTAILSHRGRTGKTVYCLEHCGDTVIEGELSRDGDAVVFSDGQFYEGENLLTVYMEDTEGMRLEDTIRTERILLDTQAPEIVINGVSDQMTAGRTVEIMCKVFENNRLESCEAQISLENTDGERRYIPQAEWSRLQGISETLYALSENGIYFLKVTAEDAAGNSDTKELQFTIDRQSQEAFCIPYTGEEDAENAGRDSQEKIQKNPLEVLGERTEACQAAAYETESGETETEKIMLPEAGNIFPKKYLAKKEVKESAEKESAEKTRENDSGHRGKYGEGAVSVVCAALIIYSVRRKKEYAPAGIFLRRI